MPQRIARIVKQIEGSIEVHYENPYYGKHDIMIITHCVKSNQSFFTMTDAIMRLRKKIFISYDSCTYKEKMVNMLYWIMDKCFSSCPFVLNSDSQVGNFFSNIKESTLIPLQLQEASKTFPQNPASHTMGFKFMLTQITRQFIYSVGVFRWEMTNTRGRNTNDNIFAT